MVSDSLKLLNKFPRMGILEKNGTAFFSVRLFPDFTSSAFREDCHFHPQKFLFDLPICILELK